MIFHKTRDDVSACDRIPEYIRNDPSRRHISRHINGWYPGRSGFANRPYTMWERKQYEMMVVGRRPVIYMRLSSTTPLVVTVRKTVLCATDTVSVYWVGALYKRILLCLDH